MRLLGCFTCVGVVVVAPRAACDRTNGWTATSMEGEEERDEETHTEQEAVKPFQLSPDRDCSVGGSYSSSVGRRRELMAERLMAEDSATCLVEGAQRRETAVRLAPSTSQASAAGGVFDSDADRCFARYDRDHDGFLTRDDLYCGLQELDLKLSAETYGTLVDCNFQYADSDGDGRLRPKDFAILHSMIHRVRSRFQRFDEDGDGLIDKQAFTSIVKELDLNLDAAMCSSYVDLNFSFVNRSFIGKVTFGQFLAGYANIVLLVGTVQTHRDCRVGGKGQADGAANAFTAVAEPVAADDDIEEVLL